MKYLLAFFIALFAMPAFALELEVPVRCAVGTECFVQNYVDQSAGSDYQDFQCNKLSYDKHDGVDVRVPTWAEMEKGVEVLAAADGTVLGARDGVDDISVKKIQKSVIAGKECGNGVVLEHEDGWQTQYCHMRKGSVRVKKGEQVKAGDVLGQIGLSGDTEFPHLHLSVRKNGEKIDPYTGSAMESGCGQKGKTLWSAKAAPVMQYRPSGLLKMGFTDQVPNSPGVLDGGFSGSSIKPGSEAMIAWALLFGLHGQDILSMKLTGPDGNVVAEGTSTIERAKAQFFQFIGKKSKGQPFQTGVYKAQVTVIRDGKTVIESERDFRVE